MDAARTAFRLSGINSKITIVYRRTISEMPADQGEIKAVIEEGMEIIELVAPIKIVSENGKVKSLLCVKMKLGEKDATGRPRPEVIPGSEFEISCDVIIPAIGQKIEMDFIAIDIYKKGNLNYETDIENIYIGGDSLRGASTAINAIGDGRKVAELIINKTGLRENQKSIKEKVRIDIQSKN